MKRVTERPCPKCGWLMTDVCRDCPPTDAVPMQCDTCGYKCESWSGSIRSCAYCGGAVKPLDAENEESLR